MVLGLIIHHKQASNNPAELDVFLSSSYVSHRYLSAQINLIWISFSGMVNASSGACKCSQNKETNKCEFACTVTKYGIFSSDHAYKTKRLSQYKYKLSVIKHCHFQMNCSFLFWNSFRKVFMRKSDISSIKQISSWQVLLHVINQAILPLKWLVKANMEKIVYKPTFSRTAAQHN